MGYTIIDTMVALGVFRGLVLNLSVDTLYVDLLRNQNRFFNHHKIETENYHLHSI